MISKCFKYSRSTYLNPLTIEMAKILNTRGGGPGVKVYFSNFCRWAGMFPAVTWQQWLQEGGYYQTKPLLQGKGYQAGCTFPIYSGSKGGRLLPAY